jgi:hypothetical protein
LIIALGFGAVTSGCAEQAGQTSETAGEKTAYVQSDTIKKGPENDTIMISKEEAIQIAQKRIEKFFDLKFLKEEAKIVDGNWEVQFYRDPPSPGGQPLVKIDGKSGKVLIVESSQ